MVMPLKDITTKIAMIALCAILTFGATGCAKSGDSYSTEINDPIEPINRGIFAFNNVIDIILIEPAAKAYNTVFPGFFRDGIRNFMRNLKSPITLANNLLQGQIGDAGVTVARFLVNTTAGVGGLVDVASTHGLTYKQEDFGQTLAVWGMGDGFYLVLPIIGPSSLRDAGGLAVDTYADPVRLWAHNTDNEWVYYTRVMVDGLDTRARLVSAVQDLRRNSLDYYAAVRSAYTQKRRSLIRNENPDSPLAIPNYDDEE